MTGKALVPTLPIEQKGLGSRADGHGSTLLANAFRTEDLDEGHCFTPFLVGTVASWQDRLQLVCVALSRL